MPFDTLTPRMRQVAESGLAYLAERHGRRNIKLESSIDASIPWRPSFYIPTSVQIVAAEASPLLFPDVLRRAALSLIRFQQPVIVHVVCPVEVFLAGHNGVAELRHNGFGLLTVDEAGRVEQQVQCVAIQQHIPEEELRREINGLTLDLKKRFVSAHAVYTANAGQGVQEVGQIVEGIISSFAAASVRQGYAPESIVKIRSTADTIDALYALPQLRPHRAALGGARDFMKDFRNLASHAPKSKRAAIDRIRRAREGFLQAVRTTNNLQIAAKELKFRISLH